MYVMTGHKKIGHNVVHVNIGKRPIHVLKCMIKLPMDRNRQRHSYKLNIWILTKHKWIFFKFWWGPHCDRFSCVRPHMNNKSYDWTYKVRWHIHSVHALYGCQHLAHNPGRLAAGWSHQYIISLQAFGDCMQLDGPGVSAGHNTYTHVNWLLNHWILQ